MQLITFQPGDGRSYRVLFGRLPGHGFVPYFLVFGIAEGSSDPGVWYAFDSESVREEIFLQHLFAHSATSDEFSALAWRVWRALTSQTDDAHARRILPPWRADWRQQLVGDS